MLISEDYPIAIEITIMKIRTISITTVTVAVAVVVTVIAIAIAMNRIMICPQRIVAKGIETNMKRRTAIEISR